MLAQVTSRRPMADSLPKKKTKMNLLVLREKMEPEINE
jgi:hypothetical protein